MVLVMQTKERKGRYLKDGKGTIWRKFQHSWGQVERSREDFKRSRMRITSRDSPITWLTRDHPWNYCLNQYKGILQYTSVNSRKVLSWWVCFPLEIMQRVWYIGTKSQEVTANAQATTRSALSVHWLNIANWAINLRSFSGSSGKFSIRFWRQYVSLSPQKLFPLFLLQKHIFHIFVW